MLPLQIPVVKLRKGANNENPFNKKTIETKI